MPSTGRANSICWQQRLPRSTSDGQEREPHGPRVKPQASRTRASRTDRSATDPHLASEGIPGRVVMRRASHIRCRGSSCTISTQLKERHVTNHQIVSGDEWVDARRRLLAKEKDFQRLRDELSRERRELPWERVTKPYVFDGAA